MINIHPELFNWVVNIRREFHQYPELSFQEKKTTARIVELLKQNNADVQVYSDLTGCVGLMRGKKPGPTIALRADIDALPIQELNKTDYTSHNNNVMHACGHDAHAAIMLGVAKKLSDSGLLNQVRGNVKFIFQPAEELLTGAQAMIERGALTNPSVDRILGCHVVPNLSAGKVGIFGEVSYSSADQFVLTITGAGTHGSRPDEGIDPVVAGGHFLTAIQTIVSRNIKPKESAVVSVGKMIAGQANNIIPETALFEGTIRAWKKTVRNQAIERLETITKGIAISFGVKCDLKIFKNTPALSSDKEAVASMRQAAEKTVGKNNVVDEHPAMGTEDFAFFSEQCPGATIRLGCGNKKKGMLYPLHSPRFDIDEKVLGVGVELFYEAVKQYLSAIEEVS